MEELAEQERQVSELRARVSPLLAAGAIVASLLARSAFGGHHPWYQWATIALGVVGSLILLAAALTMLLPRDGFGFSVNAPEAAQIMWRQGLDRQPGADFALADAVHERRERNRAAADHLGALLTLAIVALACEAVGFATAAALAS